MCGQAHAVLGLQRLCALLLVAAHGNRPAVVGGQRGLVAPRGTPPELVLQLNAAIAKAVALPEVKERFAKDAIEAAVGTPAQLGSFLERDYQDWKAVVAAQQLKIDS